MMTSWTKGPIQIPHDHIRNCNGIVEENHSSWVYRPAANRSSTEFIIQTGHRPRWYAICVSSWRDMVQYWQKCLKVQKHSLASLKCKNEARCTKWLSNAVTGTLGRSDAGDLFLFSFLSIELKTAAAKCWMRATPSPPLPPAHHCSGSSARGAPAYFPVWVWLIVSGLCPLCLCSWNNEVTSLNTGSRQEVTQEWVRHA